MGNPTINDYYNRGICETEQYHSFLSETKYIALEVSSWYC